MKDASLSCGLARPYVACRLLKGFPVRCNLSPVPYFLSMPETKSKALYWWGLVVTVLGILSNFIYFLNVPEALVRWLPWVSLIVPIIGVLLLLAGLRSFWASVPRWRKILSAVVTVILVGLTAFSAWGFVHAREVPASAGAPKLGQKVPDFTLADTTGRSVSLTDLLSTPLANSARPKAVLLVFY